MTVEKVKKPDGVTVTLCMIVKDEEALIERCLKSMLPYIDRYDITDTGSTDNTIQVIKDFFAEHGVPGEVYESDWKGFGKSRTEALRNCDGKATYAWMIDADDFVEGNFIYPPVMDLDGYSLKIARGSFSWYRNQIFKTGIGWEYVGVLHEYADVPSKRGQLKLGKITGEHYAIEARTEGARNQNVTPKEKYTNDANLLLDALTNEDSINYEPDNLRYKFYLGQSWFDAGEIEKALEAYESRIQEGGWEEEIFYSLYRIAICKTILERPEMEVTKAYIDCWAYRPIRAEPLVQLARLYRLNNKPRHAYLYASQAAKLPYPKDDILFIETDCYQWTAVDELAATAFYVGKFEEGYHAARWLVDNPNVPAEHKERIQTNFNHYVLKLDEIKRQSENTPNVVRLDEIGEAKDVEQSKGPQPKKNYKKRKKVSR